VLSTLPTAGKQHPAFERADFHARDEDCDLDEIYLALAGCRLPPAEKTLLPALGASA